MAEETKTTENAEAASRGWDILELGRLGRPPEALAASVYFLCGLFILATLVMVGFGVVASFRFAYESLTGEFKDRVEVAKVFFPVLVALIGGPLLIWRVVTAHWAAQAARHQAQTAREAHYTDLFTKAVEQLGATREVKSTQEFFDSNGATRHELVTTTEPNLEVRLGAIYALDRVARDSARDHWPIMEVLCAYIRNPQNCGTPVLRPEDVPLGSAAYSEWQGALKPRMDVQSALTVIGLRLENSRASEAVRGQRLDLRRANLQGVSLAGGNFERAALTGAHLDGASFVKARFDGALLDDAHLDRASFYEAHLDGAVFNWAHLDGAQFGQASLVGAKFNQTHLAGASFDGAHLEGASFGEARLAGASFSGAHLAGALLIGARVDDASIFTGARLRGTWLFMMDLSKVRGIDPVALSVAFGDATTVLPKGMDRPETWPTRELTWAERRVWRDSGVVPPASP